jgi:Spy/CpxP family protein refolding chaperone
MKKYLKLILASVFILSMTATAQQQTPPQRQFGMKQQLSAKERAENLAKNVSLTDVEKAKVEAVYEKNDALFTKFRTEVSRDSPDFREKFKALRDAQDTDLLAVIGKEKFETFQKLQAERRQKRMNNN